MTGEFASLVLNRAVGGSKDISEDTSAIGFKRVEEEEGRDSEQATRRARARRAYGAHEHMAAALKFLSYSTQACLGRVRPHKFHFG